MVSRSFGLTVVGSACTAPAKTTSCSVSAGAVISPRTSFARNPFAFPVDWWMAASPRCAPAAEPARTNRDASGASPSTAKAGAHDDCSTGSAPTRQPSPSNDSAALEAGQFADEASAKARCPTDTVVWVPAVEGLSFRGNEELRHHEARRLYV